MVNYKLADAELLSLGLCYINCVASGLAVGPDAGPTRIWRGRGTLKHGFLAVCASIDCHAGGPGRCMALVWQEQQDVLDLYLTAPLSLKSRTRHHRLASANDSNAQTISALTITVQYAVTPVLPVIDLNT